MKQQSLAFVRLLALLPLFTMLACGESGVAPEPEPDPTVTGSWITTSLGSPNLLITMSEQANGSVIGNGTIEWSADTRAFTISSGVHVFPNLSLTLSATGFEDLNLTGHVSPTFSSTLISAKLNGSGFDNVSIQLSDR